MLRPGKAAEHVRVCLRLPFRPGAVPLEYAIDVDEDDLPCRPGIVTITATPSDREAAVGTVVICRNVATYIEG